MRKRNSYSRIIQGVSTWTTDRDKSEKGKMIHLLHACVENNITSFDCTDSLGNRVGPGFGTALSESGLSRDRIQLMAKVKKSENLLSAVDELLLILKTDYLDLLLLEFPEKPEKLREDIDKLSSQGKILEIGGLALKKSEVESMNKIIPLRANQQSLHTLSEVSPKHNAGSPASEEIVQMISFDENVFGQKADENGILNELSSKYGIENSGLLLSYLLQHPGYLHPVISFDEEQDILMAATAKEIRLDDNDWKKLDLLLTNNS